MSVMLQMMSNLSHVLSDFKRNKSNQFSSKSTGSMFSKNQTNDDPQAQKLMRRFSTILAITAFIFSLVAFASPLSAQDFLPKKPTGMVNDMANMLSRSENQRLERKLRNYRDTTTNAIVIATIESLNNYPIEEIATKLHNSWDIQYEQRNNGVLILISKQDRQMRIEVGYGLEGAIPDIMANRIIEDILSPSFKQGDFYGGLDQATNVLIQLAAGEFQGFPERNTSGEQGFPVDLIIIFVIIIFFLISRGKSGGRKGGRRHSIGSGGVIYWGSGFGGGRGGGFGGGSSGGFGGFGGGGGFSSGGGGASGGW